jgi:hypothetical protein
VLGSGLGLGLGFFEATFGQKTVENVVPSLWASLVFLFFLCSKQKQQYTKNTQGHIDFRVFKQAGVARERLLQDLLKTFAGS